MSVRIPAVALVLITALTVSSGRLPLPSGIARRASVGEKPALSDTLRHLLGGGYQSGFASALRAVAMDSGNFRQLWAEAVRGNRTPSMPEIDFTHDMVIVAAMGSQPATGFSIRIDSVSVHGSAAQVHILLSIPGSLCVEGGVFTTPVDIVAVTKTVAIVEFHDRLVTVECKLR